MKKAKIFFGSYGDGCVTADEKFNKWIEENPYIEVIEIKYQQARLYNHSICLLYEE